MIPYTHKRDRSGTVGLVLARIGSLLFVFATPLHDQIGS